MLNIILVSILMMNVSNHKIKFGWLRLYVYASCNVVVDKMWNCNCNNKAGKNSKLFLSLISTLFISYYPLNTRLALIQKTAQKWICVILLRTRNFLNMCCVSHQCTLQFFQDIFNVFILTKMQYNFYTNEFIFYVIARIIVIIFCNLIVYT